METGTSAQKGISQEEFYRILETIVGGYEPATLLFIPGVYKVLAEEFKDRVQAIWQERRVGADS